MVAMIRLAHTTFGGCAASCWVVGSAVTALVVRSVVVSLITALVARSVVVSLIPIVAFVRFSLIPPTAIFGFVVFEAIEFSVFFSLSVRCCDSSR